MEWVGSSFGCGCSGSLAKNPVDLKIAAMVWNAYAGNVWQLLWYDFDGCSLGFFTFFQSYSLFDMVFT